MGLALEGEPGSAVTDVLPILDGVPGWGLLLEGDYLAPTELTTILAVLRSAATNVPGFWGALKRSGLTLDQVREMFADDLQKRLQRSLSR